MLRHWNDVWTDFDRAFAWMDAVRRQMDHPFDSFGLDLRSTHGFPGFNLYDRGDSYLVRAEVPGMSEKDVNVSVNQDVLTISGERKDDAPKGYTTHRRERGAARFSRSFSFPSPVDVEKVKASVNSGVLTIELAKAAEAQPRQITVKAG